MSQAKPPAQHQPPASTSPASSTTEIASAPHTTQPEKSSPSQSKLQRFFTVLDWKPKRVRWDPDNPPVFKMSMNILFGFAGAFTVANLYYSHPILNILADDFGVPYEKVSQIPTLAQAGYATGLFFLNPLGDVFRRRPFVLGLVFFTATMWLGLCLTRNFNAFLAITFITAITTVTPQLMLPLVGDLAPPDRRAAALSIVAAGNLLGILIARLLSGIVTNYTSWRNVYWIALGLNYTIFCLLWCFMPDYPSTNAKGQNYFKILWSMILMLPKHPVLVQACLIGFCGSAPFTSYWTTLTFLLAGSPYNYSPLVIGLFALIGIAGICTTPLYARIVVDRYVPLFSVILAEFIMLTGVCIGTYLGERTVAGPIIQAFFIDLGLQTSQVANRSAIYAVEPKGRNRINTVFMVITFMGQITGTAAGNKVYNEYGWEASGSLSVAFVCLAICLCFVRGPWEKGWVGWGGGWGIKKKSKNSADGKISEKAMYVKEVTADGQVHVKDVESGAEVAPKDVEKIEEELPEQNGLTAERLELDPTNEVGAVHDDRTR